jgi:endonuclease YncB( thermonuclease family)
MLRRKKPDGGFEWHEYIRTTIKVRRDARRQRVRDARRAAGQQMQAAGVALVAGSRGAIALGAGFGRARGVGLDREAVTTLLIGIVLTTCLLPMLGRRTTWRPPRLLARIAGWAAGVAVLVAGAIWLASAGGMAGLGKLAAIDRLPLVGAGRTLHGSAYAEGGDRLRVADTVVRLSGIEAPEAGQLCSRAGRSWRCGASAEAALARLVNGRRASCSLSGSDDAGRPLGRCTVRRKDVGAELVRHGHVFAEGGILPRYGSEEREARTAKAGLWSGDVERPADYRARVWEEAKRRAPDGCPIKGEVTGSARIYVLPWSPDYERARVQRARGERWFCSEQEAVAAGFRARG